VRSSDYERIADEIGVQIRSGVLRPGDRLPSISELAERYEVSQTTVKSALLVLKERGLTEGRQGRGTFVLPQS